MTTIKNFRNFFESEESNSVNKTLSRIPSSHRGLAQKLKIKFQGNMTLNNDKKNIGSVDNKEIEVAAPWNYSRELVVLHEIAHLVYEKLNEKTKKQWELLVKKTKESQKNKLKKVSRNSLNQSAEELFCMTYGTVYSKHPPKTFDHPEWVEFIKKIN
jgi:hypothetical protein